MKLSKLIAPVLIFICLVLIFGLLSRIEMTSEDYYDDGLNKIVRVYTDPNKVGSGTGFMLKTKNNKYMVTAFHVCYPSIIDKSNKVYLESDSKIYGYYPIIKTYQEYDVCLIAPVNGLDNYNISNLDNSKDIIGKSLVIIGHPMLNPLTVTIGNANGIMPFQTPFEDIILNLILIQTTVTVFPGNSGSPVLYKNKVVGLVSIGYTNLNYAGITPIEFFKKIVEEN